MNRNPLRGVSRTQAISAAVTVALIVGAVLLSDAPVWVAVAVAAVFAALIGIRCWRDYRRGRRGKGDPGR